MAEATVNVVVEGIEEHLRNVDRRVHRIHVLALTVFVMTVVNFGMVFLTDWARPNATNIVIIVAILLVIDFISHRISKKTEVAPKKAANDIAEEDQAV